MKGQKAGRATVTADPDSRHPPAEKTERTFVNCKTMITVQSCQRRNDDIALPPPSSNKPFPMTYKVSIEWCLVLACLFSGVREPWIQRNKKIYTEWVSAAGSLIWYAKINFQLTTSNRNEDDSTFKILIDFVHLRKKINNLMSINYATSNVNDARFTGDWHTLLTIDFDVE